MDTTNISENCHYCKSLIVSLPPPPHSLDMKGLSYGTWTALHWVPQATMNKKSGTQWCCLCLCGSSKILSQQSFKEKHKYATCQCLREKHGMYKTSIYKRWSAMIQRCTNPKHPSFADYGGRGIDVYDPWRKSFLSFFEDMGYPPPRMELERLDNNKGYNPENCQWANRKDQCRNVRTNRLITYKGITKSLAAWAEILAVPQTTLHSRLRGGHQVAEVLTGERDCPLMRHKMRCPACGVWLFLVDTHWVLCTNCGIELCATLRLQIRPAGINVSHTLNTLEKNGSKPDAQPQQLLLLE